uniref:Capsid protein n=1 Tax=viral metagenome TaxID=1070528 RepID=A0A6H1ZAQ8_9ZZZZ
MAEQVLDLQNGGAFPQADPALIQRATDPLVLNVGTPADFAAQFPTPLDPTEVLALCEDITLWRNIPEELTGLQTLTWREMTSLAFTSGSSWITFADGVCPEEYTHDGSNQTLTLKNIGAKKSLTLSDIKHSLAVQAAGNGIMNLVGGFPSGEGLPGTSDAATFTREAIAGLKAKEIRLAMTLVLNGWDRLLAVGDVDVRPLEFDGIENWVTSGNGANADVSGASGTISAGAFDRFLSQYCARPTHLFGHPAAIQELLSAYFQLGFAGSQSIVASNGQGIIPGFNFAGFINTGIGRLPVIADTNFTRTTVGSNFQSDIYALRMVHNGEPLVYRATQFPLALTDLVPGCTAISFQCWAKTALVIKVLCAQSRYKALFQGTVVSACTRIG